ncbi:hypothetical protein EJ03DRAFT_150368 [Teratosphaeria nubilosa]|uniref:Uncharacterized protein n=1 Tax=Teratosphaeria nubilosa TaxID=161662 RepID=A0A6G1LK19_9PEZI|nr:hypothetical protein EJ03DRAFT_150368 [Teratosphaeria nubilosa]
MLQKRVLHKRRKTTEFAEVPLHLFASPISLHVSLLHISSSLSRLCEISATSPRLVASLLSRSASRSQGQPGYLTISHRRDGVNSCRTTSQHSLLPWHYWQLMRCHPASRGASGPAYRSSSPSPDETSAGQRPLKVMQLCARICKNGDTFTPDPI